MADGNTAKGPAQMTRLGRMLSGFCPNCAGPDPAAHFVLPPGKTKGHYTCVPVTPGPKPSSAEGF